MKEKLRKILILLCILALVAAGVLVVRNLVLSQQKKDLDQQVRDLYDGEVPQTVVIAAATAAPALSEKPASPVSTGILPAAAAETAEIPQAETAVETEVVSAAETAVETEAAPAAETDAPAAESTADADAVPAELDAFGRPYHQAQEVEIPPAHPDFAKLLEANEDTIGWLRLPDMVDLPVMYRDNDYYLDYSFFRQADTNGTLFLNMHNYLYPRDDVLLIHGHHMTATGAMFGLLPRYGQLDYVKTHPLAYFRTIYDTADQVYVPVAAFTASMKEDERDFYDIMQLSFPSLPGAPADGTSTLRNSPAFQQYLREIAAMSKWQSPVDVNVDDQLLMLVTCVSEHNDGRFMLVLRRLRPGESEEEIRRLFNPEETAP